MLLASFKVNQPEAILREGGGFWGDFFQTPFYKWAHFLLFLSLSTESVHKNLANLL